MATFKSYASQGSFTPIKAPDVASMVEQKAKDQSNYMRESAQYNIDERQRIGNTIEINNKLEFQNRQDLFNFETKNLEAIQNQVMGNYQATLSNIQAQSAGEIATLNAISNISQTAFNTVQAINEKVETGRKLAVEQTLYATGITTKELMEIHKLDRNLSDQAYAENSAIRAIVDRTGASIQQIRYLHQNSNAKMWNESTALAANLGANYRTAVNDNYSTKYDLGDGRQLSLAETEGRDPGAYNQILGRIRSDYVDTSGMLNLSTSILGAKVHPQMRAIENEYTQQSNAKYRGFVKADAEQQVAFTLDQSIRNGGADYIASQLEARSGAARSAFLADVYNVVATNAEGPQREFYETLWKDLLARPTVYNGKETTYSEVLKSPAAQEVTQAFFNARQRELARYNQQEAFESRDRTTFEDYAVDVLSQKPGGFTAADVDAAIQEFGVRFPGQTSQRLEVMKNNQSVDALEIQRQVKEAEDLQNRGILTMEYMRDMGYHSSVISRFQQAAKAASDSRKANDNYKYELASLTALAKKPPQIQAKREGQFSPTVSLMEQRLHKQFYAKVAALQAAGDPNAVANAEAFVRQNFEKEIANPQFFKDGDYALFKGTPTIPAAAAARMQWVESNISRLGVKALDTNGAIYTISELNKIEEDMQKPGFKWDPLAQNLGARFGISPLAPINRQRRAAGLDPIMPPSISKFATKADPNLVRQLEQYQTPEISTRAMLSTRTFDPTLVPSGYGSLVTTASSKHGVPASIVAAVIEKESSWNPNARSSKGARGLMQLMPQWHQASLDPQANVDEGTAYLAQMYQRYGNWDKALAAYNMGPTQYDEYTAQGRRLPTETRDYVEKVNKLMGKYGDISRLQSRNTMRPSMRRYGAVSFERPSSVVFETASGQPGVDLYFESKQFPAVLDGVVKDVSRERGYGNYVVIESTDPATGQKVDVLYAHLADGLAIRPGQQIDAGDIIGTQGGTGNVRSVDGTIASIDFLAPAPRGSKSMKPYAGFDNLRRYVVSQLQR